MRKIIFLFCFFCIATIALMAQTITVKAPSVVEEGETFRISFVLNEQNNGQRMSITKVDAFEQLGEPATGIQTRMLWTNGQQSTSISYTETYTFRALKKGTFKSPVSSISLNGKTISSKAQNIEVGNFPELSGSSQNQAQSQAQALQQQMLQQMQQMQRSYQQPAQQASGEDFFTRVQVSRNSSFIGEPIYVTLKLYTLYNFDVNEQRMPKFDGFYKKILEQPTELRPVREKYNGREFYVFTFQKLVIFPQKSGNLVITPFELDCNVAVGFFSAVRKVAQSPQVTIAVQDFPAGKTADFTGAVGDFSIQAKADVEKLAADEAFTLRVTVSGQGNLSLLQKPNIEFPQDFEVYDPKIVDNFSTTMQGDKGNKTFEYVIIPRQAGKFEIPAISFQFFNPQSKSFKTLKTNAIAIEVSKGTGKKSQAVNFAAGAKSQLAYKGDDILFIKTGDLHLAPKKTRDFFPNMYAIIALVLVAGAVTFIIFKRKHIEFNSDIRRVKHKKADAESKKRLKQAQLCLDAGKESEFYDELAKALWGYVSDKFSIPLSELTIDTVREFLEQRSIENSLIQDLIDVLNHCNYARYAPVGAAANRELLERSVAIIQAFQQRIKQ
ncbi:MAG: BatD family protein [Bacteroidales bacterium]|jgi:hypothetical protein|nr:BatD family protein [Bacteroidales bacterium]